MSDEFTIRTVIFQEEGWYVAQCLDVDLATQARSLEELYVALEQLLLGRILVGEKLGLQPFDLPPAPKRYWDLYFEAKPLPSEAFPLLPEAMDLGRAVPTLELRAA